MAVPYLQILYPKFYMLIESAWPPNGLKGIKNFNSSLSIFQKMKQPHFSIAKLSLSLAEAIDDF